MKLNEQEEKVAFYASASIVMILMLIILNKE
jgi:hypothetical protein